jgi:hypothetical protein
MDNSFNILPHAQGSQNLHPVAPVIPRRGEYYHQIEHNIINNGSVSQPAPAIQPDNQLLQVLMQSLQQQAQDISNNQALGLSHAQVMALQEPLEEGLCIICKAHRVNIRLGCKHEICNECLLNIELKKTAPDRGYRLCPFCRARIVEATRFLKKYTKDISEEEAKRLYIKYKTKYMNLKNKLQ